MEFFCQEYVEDELLKKDWQELRNTEPISYLLAQTAKFEYMNEKGYQRSNRLRDVYSFIDLADDIAELYKDLVVMGEYDPKEGVELSEKYHSYKIPSFLYLYEMNKNEDTLIELIEGYSKANQYELCQAFLEKEVFTLKGVEKIIVNIYLADNYNITNNTQKAVEVLYNCLDILKKDESINEDEKFKFEEEIMNMLIFYKE